MCPKYILFYIIHIVVNSNTQFEVIYMRKTSMTSSNYKEYDEYKRELSEYLKSDMGVKKFNPPFMDDDEVFKSVKLICQQGLGGVCDHKINNKINNIKKLFFCRLHETEIRRNNNSKEKRGYLPKRRERE